MEEIAGLIAEAFADCSDDDSKVALANALGDAIAEHHPLAHHPVTNVRWAKIETVSPNDYNPNTVASPEMALLARSISSDGFTQPVVTAEVEDSTDIVDGFHRYTTADRNEEIRESTLGYVPIVTIGSGLTTRMEATVRHNRARGRHSVAGMANTVYALLQEGQSEDDIMRALGMEASELVRLTHVTGFARLMEDAEYSKAMATKRQIQEAKKQGEPLL